MQLSIKDLKKILSAVQQNNIELININSNKLALTINKTRINNHNHGIKQQKLITNTNLNYSEFININKENKNKQKAVKIKNNEAETYSIIVSPMVGTFYRSPGPNESPFIEQYDIVNKKQTVCIIEAMKLMNEIEAEVSGEIAEILVNDGDIVDCGQALMKVKPIS